MSLVSVLLPTYNVQSYIKEAVQSIFNQTHNDLDIIIVDDCSTDNTYEILSSINTKDDRIRLFRNDENKGIAETLNYALSEAKGEYMVRMDGDDISKPGRIERKLKFLENNPEYDLVGSSVKSIDKFGNILGQSKYYSSEVILKNSLKYSTPVAHIWLTKREVYEDLNGYRNISGCEDYDFLLRMVTNGYSFTNLEDYYGYYVRIRHGNTNSRIGIRQRKMHDYVYELYKERLKTGSDSFSNENLKKALETSEISNKIYNFSSKMLLKSIRAKSNKKYMTFLLFLVISMISPYQIKYLFYRLILNIIVTFKHS